MPLMPGRYKEIVILRDVPLHINEELAEYYVNNYVASATHRSAFFDENWFHNAQERLAVNRYYWESVQDTSYPNREEIRRSIAATDLVADLLARLLALPIVLPPDLLLDVLGHIFKWAALVHLRPKCLTLVCREALLWVDPIVFRASSCLRFLNPNPSVIDNHPLSPRLQRCMNFVKRISVSSWPDPKKAYAELLGSVLPNVTTLVVNDFPSGVPSIEISSVGHMHYHCRRHIGQFNLASPFFTQLTTLCMTFSVYMHNLDQWSWSFQSSSHLSFLWITRQVDNQSMGNNFLELCETRIIPALPTSLQFFALYLSYEPCWADMDDFLPEDPSLWDTQRLHSFAGGLWDRRTVLVVAKDGSLIDIPQALPLGPGLQWRETPDEWKDYEIVAGIVRARV